MTVGVSAWRWGGQRLGIGRYIEYLITHWSMMLGAGDRLIVFTHQPLDRDVLARAPAVVNRVVRPPLTNALWENLLLPRAAGGLDVLFGPSYTIPLMYRGPSVVAIHSVDEAEPGEHSLWHNLTYARKYRLSARRARRVIVNAQSTKERVERVYDIPADKIDVIWLGVDEAFRPLDDPALARAIRLKYLGIDRPFVLFCGGMSRRRNVPMLLQAFSRLIARAKLDHYLLFVGPNRAQVPLRELAAELGIADRVVQTDGIFASHRDLVPIYNAADLFVLPSSSEGFSLTLAEAMSCGTPAVTVSRAALGEVADGYAMTIREPDPDLLEEAMEQVLTSPELHGQLRARGLDRARAFSWRETARRTLQVLRDVAEQQ
jgi:glycosyltransferase involved in cell wall biosynthesis